MNIMIQQLWGVLLMYIVGRALAYLWDSHLFFKSYVTVSFKYFDFAKSIETLVPPNPKLLLMAVLIVWDNMGSR